MSKGVWDYNAWIKIFCGQNVSGPNNKTADPWVVKNFNSVDFIGPVYKLVYFVSILYITLHIRPILQREHLSFFHQNTMLCYRKYDL